MREIEFRGKVPKSYCENFYKEQFVYGSLTYCEDDIVSSIINDEFEADVLTNTVGQYTGLKDVNGVKCFEGDTVKVEYGIGVVIFQNGCFMIEWTDDKEASLECLNHNNRGRFRPFEITGNIHE